MVGTTYIKGHEVPFQSQINDLNRKMKLFNPEKKRLRELDLFVLDNSMRETTVGQLRGHTLENKRAIFDQIKKVGFKNVIVESFNHMTRLGDTFIKELIAAGEDMSQYYAFTEFVETIDGGVPNGDLPVGLEKMRQLGIHNLVMELDLVYYAIDYEKFTMPKLCDLVMKRLNWIRQHLSGTSRIFINIRDFSNCMLKNPRRLFEFVNFLSSLPPKDRIFGIAYEEGGTNLPEQLAVWTDCVREEMNRCGWNDGHLIIHVHEQFGMANTVQMDCLAYGATGIWAGLCEEGAMMGHAPSILTIINLIRLGNKKVLRKFNCQHLRTASRRITEITTGKLPHTKQPVCGDRAVDVVFGLEPLTSNKKEFNLCEFFGDKPRMRMTTLATPPMILIKLENTFGKDPGFTTQRAERMREVMLKDLHANRKEEYNSEVGLAMLYDRAGGKQTVAMADAVVKVKSTSVHIDHLINVEIRDIWNKWDVSDGELDEQVTYEAFYNGFMAPYFSCYRCDETKKALQCIDMDTDGMVDWKEFALYLKWAGNEYPKTSDAEELLDIAFRKGLLPAMQDELLEQVDHKSYDNEESGDFFKQH